MVSILLNNGADVSYQNKYNDTALNRAAYHGNTKIAQLLVVHDADVDHQPGLQRHVITGTCCGEGSPESCSAASESGGQGEPKR